jgi:hypothetical protein
MPKSRRGGESLPWLRRLEGEEDAMRFASGTFLKDDWSQFYESSAGELAHDAGREVDREPSTSRFGGLTESRSFCRCDEPAPPTLRCPVLPWAESVVSRPICVEEASLPNARSWVDWSDDDAA